MSPGLLPDELVNRRKGSLQPLQLPWLVLQQFGDLRQQSVPVAGSGFLVQVPGRV